MLRAQEGSQFQRAADAYEQSGSRVLFASQADLSPFLGTYSRSRNVVWLADDLPQGDFLMAAHHEAMHLPSWLNIRDEYRNPAEMQRVIANETRAFQQLGRLNWSAPFYYDKLRSAGVDARSLLWRPQPPR
jgi:hypothetical protein